MRIAVFSDAHGNLDGFKISWETIQNEKPDLIYFLGDIFGYGIYGHEILKFLIQRTDSKLFCLLGNHDAMMIGVLPINVEKNKIYRLMPDTLTQTEISWLSKLLPYNIYTDETSSVLFVHGTPFDPLNGYLYQNSNFSVYSALNFNFVVMGQTHRAYIKKIDNTMFVNVGSCGLPRDIGTRLSFCMLDTKKNICEIKYINIEKNIMLRNFDSDNYPVLECINRGI